VQGVSRVTLRDSRNGLHSFEVESSPGQNVRAPLARRVVENGWPLHELRSIAMSLEEVFLELTASEKGGEAEAKGERQ
jgi:hypothetical protein